MSDSGAAAKNQPPEPPEMRRIEIRGPMSLGYAEILRPEALSFLAALSANFEERRLELLDRRKVRQEAIRQGEMPDFLVETAEIRSSDWHTAPIPQDLLDRRVEITGPADRKMIINALNSGASVYMADFEDSNSPTWRNNVEGQINLRDAVRGVIAFRSPEGKEYALAAKTATLMVRPRGLHLVEKHAFLVLLRYVHFSATLFEPRKHGLSIPFLWL